MGQAFSRTRGQRGPDAREAVALPAASVGVLCTLMTCPATTTRTVAGVPVRMFVVARGMVTVPGLDLSSRPERGRRKTQQLGGIGIRGRADGRRPTETAKGNIQLQSGLRRQQDRTDRRSCSGTETRQVCCVPRTHGKVVLPTMRVREALYILFMKLTPMALKIGRRD
jgi:hypothetical protein